MFLLVLAALLAVSVLWAVSVGAVGELRRARQRDPRVGCQAWISVRGLGSRRYRCGEPTFVDRPVCRRHATVQVPASNMAGRAADRAIRHVDEPAAVGRALVQIRIGVPLAVIVALTTILLAGSWLLRPGS